MKQSRLLSLAESASNIAVGFAISMVLTATVLPALLGTPVPLSTNVHITAIYTVASLVRGYCLRRLFNR